MLNWGKRPQTRLLRNGPVIQDQGRCSEFWSIAFCVFDDEEFWGEGTASESSSGWG